MVYNKKSRSYIIRKTVFISICIICVIIISYEGYLLYRNMASAQASAGMPGSDAASMGSKLTVVRARHAMSQGELLEASKAELVEVPAELVPEGAVTSLVGLGNMRLRHSISEKEYLNEADLMPESADYEEGDRLIEHNFSGGAVPAAVAVGSAVDIKLFTKGGEDPVIVSKAVVISRNADLLSFYMNEKEQEYLKEAAAEGYLFCVMYLDDSQPPGEVDYVPAYDAGKE